MTNELQQYTGPVNKPQLIQGIVLVGVGVTLSVVAVSIGWPLWVIFVGAIIVLLGGSLL